MNFVHELVQRLLPLVVRSIKTTFEFEWKVLAGYTLCNSCASLFNSRVIAVTKKNTLCENAVTL